MDTIDTYEWSEKIEGETEKSGDVDVDCGCLTVCESIDYMGWDWRNNGKCLIGGDRLFASIWIYYNVIGHGSNVDRSMRLSVFKYCIALHHKLSCVLYKFCLSALICQMINCVVEIVHRGREEDNLVYIKPTLHLSRPICAFSIHPRSVRVFIRLVNGEYTHNLKASIFL